MKFVVTLDGSPESEAILPKLAPLAKESAATVTLLMVVEPPPVNVSLTGPEEADIRQQVRVELSAGSSQFGGPAGAAWSDPQQSARESHGQTLARSKDEAETYLNGKAHVLRTAGVEVDTAVVLDEKPAQAIADFAVEHKADVIAMSTHGRSGLSELVHGSVAGAVIKSGVAPVLVLRPV